MKELKYVITTEFGNSRDFFMIWAGKETYDDPCGMTWTRFEVFARCQRQIMVSDKLGTLTLFNTAEDAERLADECGLENYTIRQILFDTDIDDDTRLLAQHKAFYGADTSVTVETYTNNRFVTSGISNRAMKQLAEIFG
jgi:hypothetical protein